jgi:hypothetical protein
MPPGPDGVSAKESSFTSVTAELLWPTRRAISSMGRPLSESSETKLCRSSRGVQSLGLIPSAPHSGAEVAPYVGTLVVAGDQHSAAVCQAVGLEPADDGTYRQLVERALAS